MNHNVCSVGDVKKNGRKAVRVGNLEVAVFCLGDQFYAYENLCPHAGGPVCQGKILPLTLEAVDEEMCSEGRVFSSTQTNVVCPWHGMEFDVRTGEHPLSAKYRLRRLPIHVEDDEIVISLES